MPFVPVSEVENLYESGNFPAESRIFFNQCGRFYYRGSLNFRDSTRSHSRRSVPIFLDECLEQKPQTYALLKQIRRDFKSEPEPKGSIISSAFSSRSVHQNEDGYLPYSGDAFPVFSLVSHTARLYGALPSKQTKKDSKTHGHFLEYTFSDEMHAESRLVADFAIYGR